MIWKIHVSQCVPGRTDKTSVPQKPLSRTTAVTISQCPMITSMIERIRRKSTKRFLDTGVFLDKNIAFCQFFLNMFSFIYLCQFSDRIHVYLNILHNSAFLKNKHFAIDFMYNQIRAIFKKNTPYTNNSSFVSVK